MSRKQVRRGRSAAGSATAPKAGRQGMILQAAFTRFAQYGYRRTSMEDIAQEAGVSRAALYMHFRNKEEIFRALARHIQEEAIQSAKAAAKAEGPIEARILGALEAKLASFFEIVKQAPHGNELLDENNRICGDISAEYQRKYQTLLKNLIAEGTAHGVLAPKAAGLTAGAAAALIVASVQGLETGTASPATASNFRRPLAQLVRILVGGIRAELAELTQKASTRALVRKG